MENNLEDVTVAGRVTRSRRKRLESVDCESSSRPTTPLVAHVKMDAISENTPTKRTTRRQSVTNTPKKTPSKKTPSKNAVAEVSDLTPSRITRRRSISSAVGNKASQLISLSEEETNNNKKTKVLNISEDNRQYSDAKDESVVKQNTIFPEKDQINMKKPPIVTEEECEVIEIIDTDDQESNEYTKDDVAQDVQKQIKTSFEPTLEDNFSDKISEKISINEEDGNPLHCKSVTFETNQNPVSPKFVYLKTPAVNKKKPIVFNEGEEIDSKRKLSMHLDESVVCVASGMTPNKLLSTISSQSLTPMNHDGSTIVSSDALLIASPEKSLRSGKKYVEISLSTHETSACDIQEEVRHSPESLVKAKNKNFDYLNKGSKLNDPSNDSSYILGELKNSSLELKTADQLIESNIEEEPKHKEEFSDSVIMIDTTIFKDDNNILSTSVASTFMEDQMPKINKSTECTEKCSTSESVANKKNILDMEKITKCHVRITKCSNISRNMAQETLSKENAKLTAIETENSALKENVIVQDLKPTGNLKKSKPLVLKNDLILTSTKENLSKSLTMKEDSNFTSPQRSQASQGCNKNVISTIKSTDKISTITSTGSTEFKSNKTEKNESILMSEAMIKTTTFKGHDDSNTANNDIMTLETCHDTSLENKAVDVSTCSPESNSSKKGKTETLLSNESVMPDTIQSTNPSKDQDSHTSNSDETITSLKNIPTVFSTCQLESNSNEKEKIESLPSNESVLTDKFQTVSAPLKGQDSHISKSGRNLTSLETIPPAVVSICSPEVPAPLKGQDSHISESGINLTSLETIPPAVVSICSPEVPALLKGQDSHISKSGINLTSLETIPPAVVSICSPEVPAPLKGQDSHISKSGINLTSLETIPPAVLSICSPESNSNKEENIEMLPLNAGGLPDAMKSTTTTTSTEKISTVSSVEYHSNHSIEPKSSKKDLTTSGDIVSSLKNVPSNEFPSTQTIEEDKPIADYVGSGSQVDTETLLLENRQDKKSENMSPNKVQIISDFKISTSKIQQHPNMTTEKQLETVKENKSSDSIPSKASECTTYSIDEVKFSNDQKYDDNKDLNGKMTEEIEVTKFPEQQEQVLSPGNRRLSATSVTTITNDNKNKITNSPLTSNQLENLANSEDGKQNSNHSDLSNEQSCSSTFDNKVWAHSVRSHSHKIDSITASKEITPKAASKQLSTDSRQIQKQHIQLIESSPDYQMNVETDDDEEDDEEENENSFVDDQAINAGIDYESGDSMDSDERAMYAENHIENEHGESIGSQDTTECEEDSREESDSSFIVPSDVEESVESAKFSDEDDFREELEKPKKYKRLVALVVSDSEEDDELYLVEQSLSQTNVEKKLISNSIHDEKIESNEQSVAISTSENDQVECNLSKISPLCEHPTSTVAENDNSDESNDEFYENKDSISKKKNHSSMEISRATISQQVTDCETSISSKVKQNLLIEPNTEQTSDIPMLQENENNESTPEMIQTNECSEDDGNPNSSLSSANSSANDSNIENELRDLIEAAEFKGPVSKVNRRQTLQMATQALEEKVTKLKHNTFYKNKDTNDELSQSFVDYLREHKINNKQQSAAKRRLSHSLTTEQQTNKKAKHEIALQEITSSPLLVAKKHKNIGHILQRCDEILCESNKQKQIKKANKKKKNLEKDSYADSNDATGHAASALQKAFEASHKILKGMTHQKAHEKKYKNVTTVLGKISSNANEPEETKRSTAIKHALTASYNILSKKPVKKMHEEKTLERLPAPISKAFESKKLPQDFLDALESTSQIKTRKRKRGEDYDKKVFETKTGIVTETKIEPPAPKIKPHIKVLKTKTGPVFVELASPVQAKRSRSGFEERPASPLNPGWKVELIESKTDRWLETKSGVFKVEIAAGNQELASDATERAKNFLKTALNRQSVKREDLRHVLRNKKQKL